MNRCDTCITEKSKCNICTENPKFSSYYKAYEPVCPRGYTDCIYDPAYIKCYHPKWYKEKYGDMTPEQAIQVEDGCIDQMRMDPEEEYYCYDNEDK